MALHRIIFQKLGQCDTAWQVMTFFFFGDYFLAEGNITKTITATAALACFFGSHAQAQADLSMTVDGKPHTVLSRAWTVLPTAPYGLTLQIFGSFLTGKRWVILS